MTNLELIKELLEDIERSGIREVKGDYGKEHDDITITGVVSAQDGFYIITE